MHVLARNTERQGAMPDTLTLVCDLCDDSIPSTADRSKTDAADHMIDRHRLAWLADGLESCDNMHVAP